MKTNQEMERGAVGTMRLPQADRGQGWTTLCYGLLLAATVLSVVNLVSSVGGFCPVAERFFARVKEAPTVLLGDDGSVPAGGVTNVAGVSTPSADPAAAKAAPVVIEDKGARTGGRQKS